MFHFIYPKNSHNFRVCGKHKYTTNMKRIAHTQEKEGEKGTRGNKSEAVRQSNK